MPQPLDPVTLDGAHVRLVPLEIEHAAALVSAADEDRSTYDLTPVPADLDSMRTYIDQLLDARDRAEVLPFAQISVTTGAAVGCTRLLDLRWWRGRRSPDEVEVGGTWLAASAQRTGINTESKLLLLGYAFERLGVWRVAICTDARNRRSRDAIERIGATFEGVLRNHRVATDTVEPTPRQTAVYSIIDAEWPAVSARLRERLDR